MTFKEFCGYALGTTFVVAVVLTLIGGLILLIVAIPLVLILFPLTAAILGLILLINYLRHRQRR